MSTSLSPRVAAVVTMTAIAAVAIWPAVTALPGRGSVDSGDIRHGQVKTRDLASNAVTGAKVREGTLGEVPSAARADRASEADTVDGSHVVRGVLRTGALSWQPVAELGPLRVEAGCLVASLSPRAYVSQVRVATNETAFVSATSFNSASGTPKVQSDVTQSPGSPINLATSTSGSATVMAATQDGTVTSIDVAWDTRRFETERPCVVQAFATGG